MVLGYLFLVVYNNRYLIRSMRAPLLLSEETAADTEQNTESEIDFEALMALPKANAQPDGVVRDDDGEGMITEIPYKNGQKNGVMKIIQDGRLTTDMMFVNNVLSGPMHAYYPNGSIQMKMLFENGKLNGEFLQYHPNGKVSMQVVYVEGKKQGICQNMDDAGNLVQNSYYKDDVFHGAVTTYNEGEIIARTFYEEGVEIKDKDEEEQQDSLWG